MSLPSGFSLGKEGTSAVMPMNLSVSPSHMEICTYELDLEYQILAVDKGWSDFAVANGASELGSPSGWKGRSVLSFIADAETVHIYKLLFQHVLNTQKPIVVPIRCDAPDLRRFLELTISFRPPSRFHIESRLVRSEPRNPVALLDQGQPRNLKQLRMCGWCKAVDDDGDWVEVEAAVVSMRLFEQEILPQVTHTICPACQNRLMNQLKK